MSNSKRTVNYLGNCEIFSKNLRNYLVEKGVSQKEVAGTIGVARGTFCDWCKGRAYPRMDKLEKLANYFGIEKSDLIEEHDVSSQYFLKKEVREISEEMLDNPEAVALFRAIQKLSPSDMEIVLALINSLTKGGSQCKK